MHHHARHVAPHAPALHHSGAPYYQHHDLTRARVVIFYKNFMAAECGAHSHIGLGVNGLHTAKVLRALGVRADVVGVRHVGDLAARLDAFAVERAPATHAIIEAPWVQTADLAQLCGDYPETAFVVRTHSQVAFLQADPGAMRLLREYGGLQEGTLNFAVSGNSERFCDFMREAFRSPILHLPNLYHHERAATKRPVAHDHRLLRIGSFGARRMLKNHATSAAAAILIARHRGSDLEFHISSNRDEHRGITETMRAMFDGTPGMRLVEVPWKPWQDFRHVVSHMDLCLQPSATETFNICTADGIAEGVASVVSDAIEWAPRSWMAPSDDPGEIARVGTRLLSDHAAPAEGMRYLETFLASATRTWLDYLGGVSR